MTSASLPGTARIYKPAKNAMQSGRARTRKWRLEYEPRAGHDIDPLMGWTSSRDTSGQVVMEFATREAAIVFCDQNGLAYQIFEPRERQPKIRTYADNFSFHRRV
ncbi:ETC complex I subunit [Oceanibacterium hippocampi]|uniref:ETC complex I subunit conserved region n=1 Tax=Oceanibacterium hippocampi TaxID=745714 RepID=A0A1Y5U092_9PROT|nr:ETC complex I subunit [Oceanibacterium hippocampi]SLN77897.1 hypothetical protein OCH7691_04590 [Oceanibacterium hippocampi]